MAKKDDKKPAPVPRPAAARRTTTAAEEPPAPTPLEGKTPESVAADEREARKARGLDVNEPFEPATVRRTVVTSKEEKLPRDHPTAAEAAAAAPAVVTGHVPAARPIANTAGVGTGPRGAAATLRDLREREDAQIKVRAYRTGYYDDARRRIGDVFVIHNEQDFSDEWMERVRSDTPEHTTDAQSALNRETRRIGREKAGVQDNNAELDTDPSLQDQAARNVLGE